MRASSIQRESYFDLSIKGFFSHHNKAKKNQIHSNKKWTQKVPLFFVLQQQLVFPLGLMISYYFRIEVLNWLSYRLTPLQSQIDCVVESGDQGEGWRVRWLGLLGNEEADHLLIQMQDCRAIQSLLHKKFLPHVKINMDILMRGELIEWIGFGWILQIFVKPGALMQPPSHPTPPNHRHHAHAHTHNQKINKIKKHWILMKMICISRNKSVVVS